MEQKQKLANYYKELPQGFKEDYKIDAKKASVGVLLNVVGGVICIGVLLLCWYLKYGWTFIKIAEGEAVVWLLSMLAGAVSIILYLILHELTHGLFYKLLTKQKLTFGLTLSVAYCGLKEGYVNKKTAVIAMLSPFVLHSIWMIVAICLVPQMVWSCWLIVLFSLHIGGCFGDLYGTLILIFKYRGKAVLMSDSGPCQIFYTYSHENAANGELTTAEEKEENGGN